MKRLHSALLLGLSLGFVSSNSWALFGGNSDLDRRVARLEQVMNNSNQADLVMKIERLQQENQQLRGELEIQGHALDALKRRQQELYNDLDQRIRGTTGGVPAGQPGAAGNGGFSLPGGEAPAPSQPGPGAPGLSIPPSYPPQGAAGPEAAGTPIDTSQPPVAPPQSVADPHQEAAYQAAFEQLKKGEYQRAAESFRAFLSAYPQGPYSDNAQYWLGEASYVMQDFDGALAEFQKVISNYPYSAKAPDSLLKMGFIHHERRNWSQARAMLTQITTKYPSTTVADLARKRLAQITQEGH
ncbi:MAG: tol-pal system protein YbgF [Gammaproteobacteria bacterium]|nr:tol-pal system protein YbgF [Gammaproteobacteria bacterium]MBU1654257.1 tol-pal system protein YbgF [Gammaproteobacteria bacterium]MBU1960405.1 tol-pal system protein YbgF [Gammaproteobacteria bacterium]